MSIQSRNGEAKESYIREMGKETKELTEYEKYCKMMAQQQEDDMDEVINKDEMKEFQPEGVFVASQMSNGKL